MNPLIQLKKATPLFVIAFVVACFVLSPQAFGQSTTPTFSPANWSGCQHSIYVRISTTMSGANVRIRVIIGQVGTVIANGEMIPVGPFGTLTVCAQAFRLNSTIKSGWGYSTYRCDCPGSQQYCLR
jgi:hypothetical protein